MNLEKWNFNLLEYSVSELFNGFYHYILGYINSAVRLFVKTYSTKPFV